MAPRIRLDSASPLGRFAGERLDSFFSSFSVVFIGSVLSAVSAVSVFAAVSAWALDRPLVAASRVERREGAKLEAAAALPIFCLALVL